MSPHGFGWRDLRFYNRAVFHLHRIEERHCLPQLGTHLLDAVVGLFLADARELVTAGFVLLDELLGKRAVLDLFEQLLHRLFGLGGDDAWSGHIVTPLRRVGDGM